MPILVRRDRLFFKKTATTEVYPLSLPDALPICEWAAPTPPPTSPAPACSSRAGPVPPTPPRAGPASAPPACRLPRRGAARSEEHTSELQSRPYLVCRLLLEKKKRRPVTTPSTHT